MDPFERFYRRSLRDILVGQGVLTQEQADELVESAYEANEPFGVVLVDAGHLTAYELVKTVATHYQMPVLPLHGYDLDPAILEGLSPAILYQHQLLPVGRFGKTCTSASMCSPSTSPRSRIGSRTSPRW